MINNYNKNLLHENIILSSISSCINEEVKHIVPCTTIMKNASTHKYTEVEIFLIFSRTQIHISLCSLITIKNSFSYEHITSVVIDTEFNQVLKITFDTERLPQSQSKFQSLILSTSDRSALVKHLLLYHSRQFEPHNILMGIHLCQTYFCNDSFKWDKAFLYKEKSNT